MSKAAVVEAQQIVWNRPKGNQLVLKGCFKFLALFIVIIVALIVWAISSMPTASVEDFNNNRESYNEIVRYILKENQIESGKLPSDGLKEPETYPTNIQKLVERCDIMAIDVNHDNIVFIKRMIPPDYYRGYRYMLNDINRYEGYRIEKNWFMAGDG